MCLEYLRSKAGTFPMDRAQMLKLGHPNTEAEVIAAFVRFLSAVERLQVLVDAYVQAADATDAGAPTEEITRHLRAINTQALAAEELHALLANTPPYKDRADICIHSWDKSDLDEYVKRDKSRGEPQ